jgi:WD40 repeat protein/serine/threonine protein kinase
MTPCLSEAQLHALLSEALDQAQMEALEAHLAECAACQQRLETLSREKTPSQWRQGPAPTLPGEERALNFLAHLAQRGSAILALTEKPRAPIGPPADWTASQTLAGPGPAGPFPHVPGYVVLGEIGRGGMGVVYHARHETLKRPVALKMLLANRETSRSHLVRFRQEAEAAARLQHPNIVHLFEVGEAEGHPYLALEFIDGGSLKDRIDGKPQPVDAAALLVETISRAVHVAHVQGIVHRDLKPANILLQRVASGEWRVAGEEASAASSSPATLHPPLATFVPKITDFGLAKLLGNEDANTKSGDVLGTPAYMAPEQAAAERQAIGPAADIYALGAILYELLTGRPPFSGDSPFEILMNVAHREPVAVSQLRPSVPRDLEVICQKCLNKEPARRYATGLDLAADLRRWLAHEPILARPPSALYQLRKFARRHRSLVGGVLATVLALALGLVGTLLFAIAEARQRGQAEQNARQAEQNAQTANHEKLEAQYHAYRACMAAASAALEKHDVADADRHLKAAPEDLQGWEWRHLRNRVDDSSARVPLPAEGGSFLIASPDRLRVGVLTSAGLRFTNLEGGDPLTVPLGPEHRRNLSVTQTPRGLRVTAWIDNTTFVLLDDAGQVLCRGTVPENKDHPPPHAYVSPDGTRLAIVLAANEQKWVRVFDATSGKQTAICKGHAKGLHCHTFSPDGTRLATGSEDGTARVWDADNGTLLATCRGHASTVHRATFSPDGTRLLTASADGMVAQWDARTGRLVELPYDRHAALVFSAVYSPDGQWVASTGEDRTIRVWRARGRQDVAVLHGHTGSVIQVAFTPDGRRLASRSCNEGTVHSWDDTVRLWDLEFQTTLPVLRGHTDTINQVAYSPDGRWLASGSSDKTVRLWDAVTGELCAPLPHPKLVWGLGFSPDSTWLVTGCAYEDDRLRIWDVATARLRKEIPFHRRDFHFHSLTVSPDGTRVAAALEDNNFHNHRLTVFDIASGKALFPTEGVALAYSPDGRWLAVRAADEKEVLLLDARTHETVARFSGHEDHVYKAAFSPDNRCLASCSKDRNVRLWQISSGTCQVLRGHTDAVHAVAFHPDGKRLATAAHDGVVYLWDPVRGEEVVRLPGHHSFVWSLAFSPDGATLASGSGDHTIRLWDTEPLKDRYQARREAEALRPEAERLVERLWREKNDPAEVVAALRADRVLSEALRQAALRAVLRRVRPQVAAPGKPNDLP